MIFFSETNEAFLCFACLLFLVFVHVFLHLHDEPFKVLVWMNKITRPNHGLQHPVLWSNFEEYGDV